MKQFFAALIGVAIGIVMLMQPLGINNAHRHVLGYSTNMSVGGLLAYSNNQRAAAGESYLNLNGSLDSAAQAKANDMVVQNYWSHFSPSGTGPWTFIANSGYSYSAAGENLAYGYDSSADVITAWMNSAEHRANLLNGGFVDVGFGIANSPDFVGMGPETIVVAEYATPLYAPAYTAPAPSYTPPAATTPIQSTPSAPAQATPVAADTTQTAPAAATPATPPSPTAAKPAQTVTKTKPTPKKSNQSDWVTQLRIGDLARNTRLHLSAAKVSSSITLSVTTLAIALALIGHTVLPTRLR